MITLQEHMQANIGRAIANPIIDGRWHSGKSCDGKGADKISYVGHHLPKGVLVRYRNPNRVQYLKNRKRKNP